MAKSENKKTKTLSIDLSKLDTWNDLTNKSHTVNILLELAELMKHPDDVNSIIRLEIEKIRTRKELPLSIEE